MARDLSRVGERERLKPRRDPYWQRLSTGSFLGFRRSKRHGDGTWIARALDGETHKYCFKTLGDFGALPKNARFAAAKSEAEAFADLTQNGGIASLELVTVSDACREYAKGRPDAEGRFRRNLYSDPLGKVRLDKLRKHHVQSWRDRLEAKPALVSRRKEGEKLYRKRSPGSVNREMAVLRAALAKVIPEGRSDTSAAWQEALQKIRNADRQRTLYLDREQRRMLLEKTDPEAKEFFEALCLLPLRPGALAHLMVRNFDARTHELTIKDKGGTLRRIQIPPAVSRLFKKSAGGKSEDAPLFLRFNGEPWDRNSWNRSIKKAVKLSGLPQETSAYTLRHSTITDLVRTGFPLLSIAQISGTSYEMIERHYGHLGRETALDALSTLEL